MMPELDGFEVCRRLKSDPRTHHIPVVMVTALDQPSDRVRGLEAGADDFLTKPVSDIALISRVRSLARLKMVTDELRMRAATSKEIGLQNPECEAVLETGRDGRVLIVDNRANSFGRLAATLSVEHIVDIESNPNEALFRAAQRDYDLIIVSLAMPGLRRPSSVQPDPFARADTELFRSLRLPRPTTLRGSRAGWRSVSMTFCCARLTGMSCWRACGPKSKRRRYTERLRDNVQTSIELAITDGLTGLFNRRYMETHLRTLVEQSAARNKPITVLVLDIDYFKAINDSYGHDAGDDVLREFALRMRKATRNIDLACRYGGEEFVIVMPETDMAVATVVAERLRRRIATEPFAIQQGARHLEVTISIGIAALSSAGDNAASILKRADQALYRAKRDGRNRVVPDAA